MEYMYQTLSKKNYPIRTDICDYSKLSPFHSFLCAIRFMRSYAQARVVFICDSFLPVVSCRKDPRTTVVQLMHSCGLGKKIGYDSTEDIPAGYRGYVYRNYDLVTVSSQACAAPIAHGMRMDTNSVLPLGSSRSDFYFDQKWRDQCRQTFFAQHPDAVGKTVILWAPTFRGNAGDPQQLGANDIEALQKKLGEKYYIIKKVHPHVENRYHLSNSDIPTEKLLPIADLMITDYSSVVVDYMLFNKPYVLYVPDLIQYTQTRGLYVDISTLTPFLVEHEEDLASTVLRALQSPCFYVQENIPFHLSACDGHSTERIIKHLGL